MWNAYKLRDGGNYLESHLTKGDYYSEKERVSGAWCGKLAAELGLAGEIGAKDRRFESIFSGRTPAGDTLTQRKTAVHGFDFVASAPKSLSVAALLDPRLAEAHRQAVAASVADLERFAARRERRGFFVRSEEIEPTRNLIGAIFHHEFSRSLDPQLHSHVVVANATRGADGKLYALTEREIFGAIRFCSRAYEARLCNLVRRLGYDIEITRQPNGEVDEIRLAAVPRDIEETFSRRSKEKEEAIEAELLRRHTLLERWKLAGQPELRAWLRAQGEPLWSDLSAQTLSRSEIGFLVRATRPDKLAETTADEIRQAARAKLSSEQLRALEALAERGLSATQEGKLLGALTLRQAADHAREHLLERKSVVAAHQVAAEVLAQSCADPAGVERALASDPELLDLTDEEDPLRRTVTTRLNLRLEQYAIAAAAEGRTAMPGPLCPQRPTLDPRLDKEQANVVAGVCAANDRVQILRGVAGSGKSTTLRSLDAALREQGVTVRYLGAAGKPSAELTKAGLQADTLALFLLRAQDPPPQIVVVDEAGQIGIRSGAQLLERAKREGFRVLLVGDVRQHSSVDAGDFLRLLEDRAGLEPLELGRIRRQQIEEYKQAISLMAAGEARAGAEALDRLGWVREEGSGYVVAAAEKFVERYEAGDALAVAPTRDEALELGQLIRRKLQEKAVLKGPTHRRVALRSLQWTKAQCANIHAWRPGMIAVVSKICGPYRSGEALEVEAIESKGLRLTNGRLLDPRKVSVQAYERAELEIQVGDRLLITRKFTEGCLVTGDVVQVQSIDPDGTVRTTDGRWFCKSFLFVEHGCALTTWRSQGLTADAVVVAANRLGSKAAYVGCSRGRFSCDVYTPAKESLLDGLGAPGDRLAAVEALRRAVSAAASRIEVARDRLYRLASRWLLDLEEVLRPPGDAKMAVRLRCQAADAVADLRDRIESEIGPLRL